MLGKDMPYAVRGEGLPFWDIIKSFMGRRASDKYSSLQRLETS